MKYVSIMTQEISFNVQFTTQSITQWETLHSLIALLEDWQALVQVLEQPVLSVNYSFLVKVKVCSVIVKV